MPRRRRFSKARVLWLTGQEHGALRFGTAATMEYVFGSLDVAREAWSVHRMRMLAACGENGTRPEAFWLFEAPAELHTWAPRGLEATATARGIAEYRRRRMDLAARRLAWLSERGLLSAGETAAASRVAHRELRDLRANESERGAVHKWPMTTSVTS